MKPRPKNKRSNMNIIGGGMSSDVIQQAFQALREFEATTKKNQLISNISSKMETAGFVPAFLDGSFKSQYVDFQVEFLNPASSGINISAENSKYNLSFAVALYAVFKMSKGDSGKIEDVTVIYVSKFKSDSENIEDSDGATDISVNNLGKIMNTLETIYEKMAKLYNDALLKEIQKEDTIERVETNALDE